MASLFHTSIAARSTAVILAIVGLVGIVFLSIAIALTERQAGADQQARLNELLETVQRTASIACFLSDRQLADEVALGLISNRTVGAVTVYAGGERIAHRGRTPAAGAASAKPPEPLVRNVVSPFDRGDIVGQIALVPDAAEIRNNVLAATRFISLLLAVQMVFTGAAVVAVVIRFITRPISRISARLHELRAETGQKLEIPRGSETDEIGQLVRDVNAMVDYLVSILGEERGLRLLHEIEEKKFRTIFEHADTGIFLLDESGRMISWNPAFAQFFGLPEPSASQGLPSMFADLLGEHRDEGAMLISRCVVERKSTGQDFRLGGAPGLPKRWVSVVLSPVEDNRIQGVVNDVTERKRAEEAAQELAVTDRLTSLGNRLAFERRLERMIDASSRAPVRRFVLLMMDLDWFKQVNDSYGHHAGDEVLVVVARRLENAVRKSDFVGRLGGDEFVVLLDGVHDRESVERIASKIISAVGEPIAITGGMRANVGASVGAAVFDGGTATKDDLIRRADEAMYQAKQSGRNRYRFYEDTVSL
ncbi:MAG: hypothetical protein A3I02_08035 [Betaproteobacteria bacterium RIFCSPLOWO2_02_FULL_67_26]|nr:MAG: hypothetical protein A3I02_08035 [Betaproteobacteria bacterium RIFCSPLOWO2_02_FULL_67_26]